MTKFPASKPLFLLLSGINTFGCQLSLLAFLKIIAIDGMGDKLPVFYFFQYLGIVLSGILIVKIVDALQPRNTILLAELSRAVFIFLLLTVFHATITSICLIWFLLFFMEGIYHPARYKIIFSQSSDLSIQKLISQLQAVDNMATIIGPLVAVLLLERFSIQACFFIDASTYLANFVYWRYQERIPILPNNELRQKWFIGFSSIVNNRSLLWMNSARIFGNVLFISWSIWLPLWLMHSFPNLLFTQYQGFILSVYALGVVTLNFLGHFFSKNDGLERALILIGLIVLPIAFMFIFLGAWNINLLEVIIAAFFMGLLNGSLRTSGILIGKKITPKEKIESVIAAGDTIVRLLSAAIAPLIGVYLVGAFSANQTIHLIGIFSFSLFSAITCLVIYKTLSMKDVSELLLSRAST